MLFELASAIGEEDGGKRMKKERVKYIVRTAIEEIMRISPCCLT